MNSTQIKEIIAIVIDFIAILFLIYKKKKVDNPVKFITVCGIFGAIAIVLYVVVPDFGLGFTPPWLKVHLDEIPMLLAGFMYGPIAAIVVNLIKTLVKLPLSTTACVGEIGDFLFSIVFVIPAVIFYQKKRDFTSVLVGIGISTFAHVLFAIIMNVYFMVPFYSMFYNIPVSVLGDMCSKIIPIVSGENWVWMYALLMVFPMNLVKDGIVIVVVLLVYKRLHILINRIGEQNKNSSLEEQE